MEITSRVVFFLVLFCFFTYIIRHPCLKCDNSFVHIIPRRAESLLHVRPLEQETVLGQGVQVWGVDIWMDFRGEIWTDVRPDLWSHVVCYQEQHILLLVAPPM